MKRILSLLLCLLTALSSFTIVHAEEEGFFVGLITETAEKQSIPILLLTVKPQLL